ncbi:Serpentine receptor class gamma-2 [Caenorhabditis elegans]|uniref:Serpentine receptor class gamma-2 n=1 Tax=Caenorhabditis elegans TaxID=6239 RepID=SRG2_CAEEL|nr:Serpentine receptor class gamma-2 [Caenorhabditis elegans]P46571.2 RecName: Full=Serpentine receptor class gamma-2; Short=Protein srg-2 [Caenorhabditis elegans]CCD65202.1 Serpentine receptor class gamma-2 [Caenorhabditis elegans]|eukprot:NP_498367.2 Serpentine receptor class gamma-2 [Caenorhabditis elegans]
MDSSTAPLSIITKLALFERTCDSSYSPLAENLKYLVQFVYLLPAAMLHARILYILLWKHRNLYLKQSFYILFIMSCIACFTLVVQDIFFARVFQYMTQFCEPMSEFVENYPIFPAIYYPLQQHLHCAQPIIQILLTVNRMSCVVIPWKHSQVWKSFMKYAIALVILTPFLFIWNIIISKKLPVYTFGGFYIGYERVVIWATMTLFMLILRAITIVITAVCTFITVLRLTRMSKRLVSSERTLCIASFLISSCFLGTAAAESLFAFQVVRTSTSISYFLLPISWDILNVGTPIVMVMASSQLRRHVFGILKRSRSNSRVEDGTIVTGF